MNYNMKTITNITTIDKDNILVTYINELNIQLNKTIEVKDIVNFSSFKNEIQTIIDNIPDNVESPIFVKYQEDIFTITGNKKEPVLMKYEYLSDEDKAIIDDMKFKVYQVLGEHFVWLQARLNSDKITVNSIEYDYNMFRSEAFTKAIQLANKLLNQQ